MVLRRFALIAILLSSPAALLHAGGGPEHVLLVVNRDSVASRTIANHFQSLRRIPDQNVLYLPLRETSGDLETTPKTVLPRETIGVDAFRRQILVPVLMAIQSREAERRIDYVVYSCDFPPAVDLQDDVARYRQAMGAASNGGAGVSKLAWPKSLGPVGSINGLTYLGHQVMVGGPGAYMSPRSNQYMRRAIAEQADAPTLAFRSDLQFGRHGEVVERGGNAYLLSTMLGVTSGRGNSLPEVLRYLKRSAAADGSHPRGTIYYAENSNVRSRTRDRAFDSVVRQLKQVGVAAKIVQGKVPRGRTDVQGVTMGTASFDWANSGSTLLPGAIADNLTSYGGVMRSEASQTPLSEFLRHGAAGASGTVAEPLALQSKFPLATIHLHYARGCTLAEAFYQSVFGPYQLLIVGDPLCRPWADIPTVELDGLKPGETVFGKRTIRPSAASGARIESFEVYINATRLTQILPGDSFTLDTTLLSDGYHELRIVATESSPAKSQGRVVVPFSSWNYGRSVRAVANPQGKLPEHTTVTITVTALDAKELIVRHNTEVLGRLLGKHAQFEIDTRPLGAGPVKLHVTAIGSGGFRTDATAEPIELELPSL